MAEEKQGKSKKKTDKKVDLDALGLDVGHKPPQALDFEENVLGALLVEPNCIDEVMEDLNTDRCFYSIKHRLIFSAIRDLYNDHAPVDLNTVSERLRVKGDLDTIGGSKALVELTYKIGAAASIQYYSKIVKQKFIQRELITASYKILEDSYDEAINVDELIDSAQTRIFDAVQSNVIREAQEIGSVINRALAELERLQNLNGALSGVPSGFKSLDDVTLGWQPSDLIILAARPSVGKTAFAINVARNAAVDHNVPVAIFSLEMPASQLAKRMMVTETEIDSKKIKGGSKLEAEEWQRLETNLRKLASAPIYIDDTPSLPVMEFRSKVKKLVKQKGVKLIVVDYLQLMQGPVESRNFREQEVAAISRTLKATAKEHNVPIIALSQLSRNAVQRQNSNNRPQLSDLRESGSIEQDADMVLFIHRLDYQGLGGEEVQKGQTQLIIAKHRNGEIKDIDLIFHDTLAKFTDAADEQFLASTEEYTEVDSKMNTMAIDDYSASDYPGGLSDPDFGDSSFQ